jgi:hypothetical protein
MCSHPSENIKIISQISKSFSEIGKESFELIFNIEIYSLISQQIITSGHKNPE